MQVLKTLGSGLVTLLLLAPASFANDAEKDMAETPATKRASFLSSCMEEQRSVQFRHCLADYRGSPLFRARCEMMTREKNVAIRNQCDKLAERRFGDTVAAH
jgi:hypothetical protein